MRKLVLVIVLVACAPPQHRDSLVVRVAMWGALGPLKPLSDDPTLATIAFPWVFERIGAFDESGHLRPALAATIEPPLSRFEMRFTLRQGATFSDGSPVSESVVIQSLAASGLHAEVKAGALLVESRDRMIPIEVLLNRAPIYHEVDGQFLGSGPFAVAEQNEREMRFVRRRPDRGRINDVRFIAYKEPHDAFAHTLKGDANLILDLEPRLREFFEGVPSLRVIRGAGRSTDAIIFNLDLSRDERARLAAVLESDQVRDLAYGRGECAESREAHEEPKPLPPGRALNIVAWGPFERLAVAARRALGDRGGEVILTTPRDALDRVKRRQYDTFTARPLKWPPSAMFLLWHSGSSENLVGYSNPAMDRALDSGDWVAAERTMRSDPPAAFICTRDHLAVVDTRIKNPVLGPSEVLETLPDWEVAQ